MVNLRIICKGEDVLNLECDRKTLEDFIEKYKVAWMTSKLPNIYQSLSEAQYGLVENKLSIFEPLYKIGKDGYGNFVVLETYKYKK